MIVKRRRVEGGITKKSSDDLDGVYFGEGKLRMVTAAVYLPKDNDSKPLGEDAHFVCPEKETMGVADGVGGWARLGVDAGVYARELMTNSVIAVLDEVKGSVDPRRVLNEAYSKTKAQGSSTACIVTLKDHHYLHAVNVGDSGFMLFRDNRFLYKSPAQQRGFNCPFQLGNSKGSDRPSSGVEIRVGVMAGDVVVLGTDGLFDNMFRSEMEDVIIKKGAQEPKQVALTIAELALYNSFDRFAESPFERASKKAGFDHKGGKVDDITVVVGFITASAS